MRNRIYITSIHNPSDINSPEPTLSIGNIESWSKSHRDILVFSPEFNGLFINGKVYHSLDDIENNENVKSVFRLTILQASETNNKYDTNYIKLVQEKLKTEFDISSLIFHVPIRTTPTQNLIYIDMNIGDRIQMFINYNGNFKWECENPNIAVVDRNYIIHALSVSSGHYTSIYLIYNGELLYTLKIRVWSMGVNITQNNETSTIINNMGNNTSLDYNTVIHAYESIATHRGNIPTEMVTEIANEYEMDIRDRIDGEQSGRLP